MIARAPASAPLSTGFGLVIRSDIVLPGAAPTDDAHADIEIVWGSMPDWRAIRTWEVYRIASADLFEIAMPGLARFTCLDRRRIVVDPAPGADRVHLAEMIVATVLPAILWARGEVVLHASAFVLPGATHGIAVCGSSGSGKSTALGRALAIGARQIADDSICVRIARDTAAVAGLSGGFFERRGDARAFRTVAAPHRQADCVPGALLVLTPDTDRPRRLAGPEALAALLRHRHRPRIAMLLGTEPALLPTIAAIARVVPIIAVPIGTVENIQ